MIWMAGFDRLAKVMRLVPNLAKIVFWIVP
jgi:hypothetical protein